MRLTSLARRLRQHVHPVNRHHIRFIYSIIQCHGVRSGDLFVKDVHRWMASASNKRKDIVKSKASSNQVQLGLKVAQAGKDITYIAVVIVGAALLVAMFYTVGQELMDSKSPNSVFTRSLKLCKNNYEVVEAVGEPVKGYGEMDRRGRRRHVSHMIYTKNNIQYMRMKFYIEGSRRKGTVHLQVEQVTNGNLEYNYLYVDLDGYPQQRIIIEDGSQV